MSWKSLVTAGLLCVLASPAFAAPTVTVTKGGTFANGNLDANGNWVWTVAITPDQTLVTGGTGTPLAAELGYASNRAVISVANATPAVFDTNNPGTQIFTWETLYGTPAKPEGIEANCTCCTVTNTAASGGHAGTVVAGALNQIFAALGSANTTSTNAQNMLTVTVAGPTNTNNNTTLTESGAYGGKGRVAQISGTNGANFDTFSGAFSRTVHAADATWMATSTVWICRPWQRTSAVVVSIGTRPTTTVTATSTAWTFPPWQATSVSPARRREPVLASVLAVRCPSRPRSPLSALPCSALWV